MQEFQASIYWTITAVSFLFVCVLLLRIAKWDKRIPSVPTEWIQKLRLPLKKVKLTSIAGVADLGTSGLIFLSLFVATAALLVPIIWETQTALLCKNGGYMDALYKKCYCPACHYDDGIDCSRSQVNATRGYIVSDSTSRYGSYVVCYDKYHGCVCELCHANMSTGGVGCNGDCDPDYYRDKCDYFCTRNSTCSGHGSCTQPMGYCECDHGYFGLDCSQQCPRTADGKVCNDHGTCIQCTGGECPRDPGSCNCDTSYVGKACEGHDLCPNGTHESLFYRPGQPVVAMDLLCASCNPGFTVSLDGRCVACPDGCNQCRINYDERCPRPTCCTGVPVNDSLIGCAALCPQSVDGSFTVPPGCVDGNCINGRCSSVEGVCNCFANFDNAATHHINGTIDPLYFIDTENSGRYGCVHCNENYFPPPLVSDFMLINDDLACSVRCDETTCNGHGVCDDSIECCNGRGHTCPVDDDGTTCKKCICDIHYMTGEDGAECMSCDINHKGRNEGECDVFCNDDYTCGGLENRGRCIRPHDAIDGFLITQEFPCRCVKSDGSESGYDHLSNCTGFCNKQQDDSIMCSGHGACDRDGVCICDDNYFGNVCEFTAHLDEEQFWYTNPEGGEPLSVTCSGQPVVAAMQYRHNGVEYNTVACAEDADCCQGCSADERATARIYCYMKQNTTVTLIEGAGSPDGLFDDRDNNGKLTTSEFTGVCKRVKCDCEANFRSRGGPGCQLQGCPTHTWVYSTGEFSSEQKVSVCGQDPPLGTNMHCARGKCTAVDSTAGMSPDNPAKSASDYPLGKCQCYAAVDTVCKANFWGKPEYATECCGKSSTRYLGNTCSDRCLCDDPYFGTCGSDYLVSGASCQCRRGYQANTGYNSTLFTGPTCGKVCPGIVNIETGEAVTDILPSSNGGSTDRCRNYKDTFAAVAPDCFVNLAPCNNQGECVNFGCTCYGLSEAFVRQLLVACTHHKHDDSVDNCEFLKRTSDDTTDPVYQLSAGPACASRCPTAATDAQVQAAVDFYRENRVRFFTNVYSPAIQFELYQQQLDHTRDFIELYHTSACSGHGTCGADATCTCASDYAGADCSGSCPTATDIIDYFGNQSSDALLLRLESFHIGRCGVHAQCLELEDSVICACKNDAFQRPADGVARQHLLSICQSSTDEPSKCPAAVDTALDVYSIIFDGECADCKPGLYTSTPAEDFVWADMPQAVEWQLKRTCDANISDVACCLQSQTDWEAYGELGPGHYGGCTQCHGLMGGRMCDTCKYGLLLDTSPDTPCESKCVKCREPGHRVFPYSVSNPPDESEPHINACGECITGVNGLPCSGRGACVGKAASYSGQDGLFTFQDPAASGQYDFTTCHCNVDTDGPSCSNVTDNSGCLDDSPDCSTCKMNGLDPSQQCREYFDEVVYERRWRVCMCMQKNAGKEQVPANNVCQHLLHNVTLQGVDWATMCDLKITYQG